MHTSTIPHGRQMVTTKPSITDLRRDNLRSLIRERYHNSPSALATDCGYTNGSFIVQMAGPSPTRVVTEKTARKIEQSLKLPEGWLDQDHSREAARAVHEAPAPYVVHAAASRSAPMPSAGADSPLVADVVRLVGEIAQAENVSLPPAKLADVVALAWTDTLEHNGQPREQHIRGLVKLLKG